MEIVTLNKFYLKIQDDCNYGEKKTNHLSIDKITRRKFTKMYTTLQHE